MSASARSSAAAAVAAELQSRHATEVRSYAGELWPADSAGVEAACAAFWREWTPPPGSADEIPREYVFAGARRQVLAAQRRAGRAEEEGEADAGAAEAKDPSARVASRFRRLTQKQQEMVGLHLHHRFDLDEMAVIADLTPAGAAQLLHTAIARLHGSGGEEARLVALALAGAAGEQIAAETPENRTRVAEMRVTIEVTRQVLARGLETFRPRKPAARLRRIWWIAAGAVGVLVAAIALWWTRGGTGEKSIGPEVSSEGRSRVALRREAGDAAVRRPGLGEGGTAAALTPASIRRAESHRPATVTPVTASDRATQPGAAAMASGKIAALQPDARADGAARELPRKDTAEAPLVAAAGRIAAAENERPAAPAVLRPASARGGASELVTREPLADIARAPGLEETKKNSPEDRLDTAPIAALRKALGTSRWPARQEVRVEAMLNAFPPATPAGPAADGPAFTTRVESSESPANPARRLVRVVLRAKDLAPAARAPATVILLLDVSGSMDAPNRLPLVQAAVGGLLRRLRPEDRVGIVTYAGESRVLRPPSPLSAEREIRAAVDALEAKGRTNGGAGLREAYALAKADGRGQGEHVVLLCTDGDFNMGETSERELGALIDRHRESGVRLGIFGFGRPDRIDARLEALAARARGGSGYVNTRAEAEQALVAQLDRLFAPVAEQMSATVEFDPAAVAAVRRAGEDAMQPVARGRLIPFGGRKKVLPGEEISTLFEIEPVSGAAPETEAWRVRVACTVTGREGQGPYYGLASGGVEAGSFERASVDFRFAAAVAAFGEALRAGPTEGAARLDEIERWAQPALGEDAGGYRAEFQAMIGQARRAAAGVR